MKTDPATLRILTEGERVGFDPVTLAGSSSEGTLCSADHFEILEEWVSVNSTGPIPGRTLTEVMEGIRR
jgi:hypothetical protein